MPGGPSLRVRHSICGPPGMRSGAQASSMPRVTASVELGLMKRIRCAMARYYRFRSFYRTIQHNPESRTGVSSMLHRYAAAVVTAALMLSGAAVAQSNLPPLRTGVDGTFAPHAMPKLGG